MPIYFHALNAGGFKARLTLYKGQYMLMLFKSSSMHSAAVAVAVYRRMDGWADRRHDDDYDVDVDDNNNCARNTIVGTDNDA